MSCANRNDDSCFAGSLLSYIDECWKAYIKSLEHGVGFHLQFFFVALGNGVPGKKVSGVEGEVEEST
jgi:hypothetical protein